MAYVIDRTDLVLTLTVDTPTVVSPGSVQVSVANGTPDGSVNFFLDGSANSFYTAELSAEGAARQVYLPIRNLGVGAHSLIISEGPSPSTNPQASGSFQVSESRDPTTGAAPAPVVPPAPNVLNRWVFQAYDFSDPALGENTYVLPVNPSAMELPLGDTEFTDEATTVSNGKIITWEGAPRPVLWSLDGRVFTENDYRQMVKWAKTKQRFYVTDHLARRYLVKAVEIDFQRVRDKDRDFHHRYSLKLAILAGPGTRKALP